MYYKKQLLVIDTEATYGTATSAVTTPTATYFIKAINPQYKVNGEVVERPFINDTWGRYAHYVGKRSIELTFQHEMTHYKSSVGAISNTTVEGRLLKAAGLKETYNSTTSVVYTPSSTESDHKSVCGRLYFDGFYLQFTGGVVKTAKLMLQGGQPFMLEFTISALYSAPVDFASFPSETYPTYATNVIMASETADWATLTDKYEITIENTLAECPDLSQVSNISKFKITDRKITGKANVEAVKLATHDTFLDFMSGLEEPILLDDISDSGATFTNIISMPKCQLITPPNFANREGILAHDLEWQCNRDSTGDDEITITYGYIAP